MYSLACRVSSSPISLLHLDPPQVYTTARRNARPHSRIVFVLSCVWTCATHNMHSSIASRSMDLMLFIFKKHLPWATLLFWIFSDVTHFPKSSTGDSSSNGVYYVWQSLCAFISGCQSGHLGYVWESMPLLLSLIDYIFLNVKRERTALLCPNCRVLLLWI